MLNVLVIAPQVNALPRLSVWDEVGRLGDLENVKTEVLAGTIATRERIAARIERRKDTDIILWIGHGHEGQLLVPGGGVEPNWLAAQVAGTKLLILSVCDSAKRTGYEGYTDTIPAAGVNLIAMSIGVSDKAAMDYDLAVLSELAHGASVREAHRIGVERIKNTPDVVAPQLYPADSIASQLHEQVDSLANAITNGDAATVMAQVRAIGKSIDAIKGDYFATRHDIDVLDNRVTKIEKIIKPSVAVQAYRASSIVMIVFAIILLVSSDVRDTLSVNVFPTFYFIAGILTVSGVFAFRIARLTAEREKGLDL